MRTSQHFLLLPIHLALSVRLIAAPAAEAPSFFRSDLGIAAAGVGSLPETFDSPTKPRWQTPMDSGQSTPVIWGNRIFLTTWRAATRELAVVALDRDTGAQVWKQIVPVQKIEVVHPTMGNPASATPACDGRRLYTFFGSVGVICYDLEGKKLWEHAFGPFQDEYGSSSSPVLLNDKLFLCEDHDIGSVLTALDTTTGKTLWQASRPDAVRSYSTPAIWQSQGRDQLVVAGSIELAGYDPANGEKLWWVDGLARIVIPAPVPAGDTIFMASWTTGGDTGTKTILESWPVALQKWDKNGDGKLSRAEVGDPAVRDRFFRMDLNQDGLLDQAEWERHAAVFLHAENAVLAVKPSGRGDLTDKAVAWKYTRGVPYVPSPLAHGGLLWMVKDGGIVTRLDVATGRLVSDERLPGQGAYYASPVAGDGKVYFASENGMVSVVADAPDWKLISSHKFEGKIYGTPVLDHNRVYIRTDAALYCFERPTAAP